MGDFLIRTLLRYTVYGGYKLWEHYDNTHPPTPAEPNRKPVQADFDEIAATVVRNRAEAKTKLLSGGDLLERDRSQSSEDLHFIDEHLPEIMLPMGAAKLPEMSTEAVFAWASHVKGDPLIQSSDSSKILEREIAAYDKFGWTISKEPFEAAGNLCCLLHVTGMNVRTRGRNLPHNAGCYVCHVDVAEIVRS